MFLGGWVGGWVGGRVEVKAVLRISYSNQQTTLKQNTRMNETNRQRKILRRKERMKKDIQVW
jgi:hypothetical protein